MALLPVGVGIGAVLSAIIVPLGIRLLAGLGIGFVTYTGINLAVDGALELIQDQFALFDSMQIVALLGFMNVDRAISMIFAAITMKLTLQGLGAAGVIRKVTGV